MVNKINLDSTVLFVYSTFVILFAYDPERTYIPKIVAALVVVAFLSRGIFGRQRFQWSAEWTLLLTWLLFAGASNAFANEPVPAFDKMITVFQVALVSYAIFNIIIWNRSLDAIWLGISLTCVVVGVMAINNPEEYSKYGRLIGTVGNANMFGYCLYVGTLVSWYFAMSKSSWLVRMVFIGIMVFLFVVLTMTGSRKAMFGILVGVGMVGVIGVRQVFRISKVKAMLAGGVAAALLLSAMVFVEKTSFFYRMERLVNVVESQDVRQGDESIRGRLALYEHAFQVFLENPILGVGLDNYRSTRSGGGVRQIGTYSHANYTELLSSTGLVGFVLFFSIYVAVMIRLLKMRRIGWKRKNGVLYITLSVLMLGIMIYDFGMVSYYEKANWLVLATVLAGVQILKRDIYAERQAEVTEKK